MRERVCCPRCSALLDADWLGGGGSGGGRMRKEEYGIIGLMAVIKSLRCGKGSGISIASSWQFGSAVEYISCSSG